MARSAVERGLRRQCPTQLLEEPLDADSHGAPAPVLLVRLQPSECGPAYVFLASQESTYMTGQTLHVDGGLFVGS